MGAIVEAAADGVVDVDDADVDMVLVGKVIRLRRM
jgi:hypothetical protein